LPRHQLKLLDWFGLHRETETRRLAIEKPFSRCRCEWSGVACRNLDYAKRTRPAVTSW